jgi:hypothetical protein
VVHEAGGRDETSFGFATRPDQPTWLGIIKETPRKLASQASSLIRPFSEGATYRVHDRPRRISANVLSKVCPLVHDDGRFRNRPTFVNGTQNSGRSAGYAHATPSACFLPSA